MAKIVSLPDSTTKPDDDCDSDSSLELEYMFHVSRFNDIVKYPSLADDKDFKVLLKEVGSEPYLLCREDNKVIVQELQAEEIESLNLQRTYFFLKSSPQNGTVIDVFNVSDTFESYIIEHVNKPIKCTHKSIRHRINTANSASLVKTDFDKSESECFNTPLIEAILQKKWYIAQVLLFYGADVTRLSSSGKSPLHEAMQKSDVPSDIVRDLITKYNVNMEYGNGNTALHLAIIVGYQYEHNYSFIPRFDLVDILCERGANPNIYNNRRQLPIHLALYCSSHLPNLQSLKRLVTEKNINALDKYGRTPLHLACSNNHIQMISFLVKNGSDLNMTDNNLKTPLLLALMRGSHMPAKLIERLITDENVNFPSFGTYPLCMAIQSLHWDAVLYLLAHGADVNSVNIMDSLHDDCELTALHLAVGHPNTEKYLKRIISSENINKRSKNGKTPLLWALKRRNYGPVPCLIDSGADINMRTDRYTPLLSALRDNDPNRPDLEILKQLVSEKTVNVCLKNVTAFRRAFETGRWKLIRVLLQYGADGPDVRGASAAGRKKCLDPHVRGRFDEQPDSLLDITVCELRRTLLVGFDDEHIFSCIEQLSSDDKVSPVYLKCLKRHYIYKNIKYFKDRNVEERKLLMKNMLDD